jgi:hypothetical protein
VTPDSSEVYHLTVSDGFNQAAGTTSLTVFQLPSATILGGDTLCGSGLTTLLTINLTGTPPWSFEYSDGVTTYPVNNQNTTPYLIVTGIPGIYTVFALKDAHCDGTTSGTAIVAVFPIPPTPTISQFGNELYSTSCCGNQWYKDNVPVAGETAQTITPVESGHYYDIVNLNSCVSDTSNDIYFVVDGTADPAAGSFMISPNPARESITILSVAPLNSPVIDIYSATGQLMQHIPSGTTQTGEGFKIDIRALSPGFYLVAVRSQEVCTVKKLIIE